MHTAVEVFAARGFDATATSDICLAACMSPGNLFHYFACKRDVFLAVVRDREADKAQRLRAARESDDAWLALP